MKMLRITRRRVTAGLATLFVAGAVTAVAVIGPNAIGQVTPAESTELYLVATVSAPVSSYDGGVPGIPATRPDQGEKLDPDSPAAQAYQEHLEAEHERVLEEAGVPLSRKTLDLNVAFNGFVAELTATEAARLAKVEGVVKVFENETFEIDTSNTPDFLGLTGPDGVWNTHFGGQANAGEGVIIGVIDTGFWPENPSFAPLPEPRPDQAIIDAKWHGTCQAGVEQPITCNNKVIGARYFHQGVNIPDYEYESPRDYHGHGSHTASTAAGNANVPAVVDGSTLGVISGMAPAARIAVYKALWTTSPDGATASGSTVNLVAAINAAVADGVDVINFSISGTGQFIVDSVSWAFLNAADAGVFVAASAGNDGPGVSTVNHVAPWVTTVAAGTHSPASVRTVTLGDGTSHTGAGTGSNATPSAEIIDSTAAGLPGADPTQVRLCYSSADGGNVLDPAKVAGKIVICERGVTARVNKSLAVKEAGGVGLVLYNATAGESLNGDIHSVPTVHVGPAAGNAIKAYAATAGATASISASVGQEARAPQLAGFSSQGPAIAGGGDLLKPDIMGPGVDVLAASSPSIHGYDFNYSSGTSMSAPHIAGLAALLKSSNPDWSPMWIKSALMTTATDRDNTGQPIQRGGNATPLDYGAGQVNPGPAFTPGVVFDSIWIDWYHYACSIGQLQLIGGASVCAQLDAAFGPLDPSNFNSPSIAIGALAGQQTVTRTVTNITGSTLTYTPSVSLPGFTATVSPSSISVPAGGSATFSVSFTRTSAPLNQYAFGRLTLDTSAAGVSDATLPIAVRPVALAVPSEVTLVDGKATISGTSGFTGTATAAPHGLAPASVIPLSFTDWNDVSFNVNEGLQGVPWIQYRIFDVPANTSVLRVATFDADFPVDTDTDLFLYKLNPSTGTISLVDTSTDPSAEEAITLANPASGPYVIFVHLWWVDDDALPAPVSESAPYAVPLNIWTVPPAAVGNMSVSPTSQAVTLTGPFSVTVTASGLNPTVRYLGAVAYTDGSAPAGVTIVNVPTPGAPQWVSTEVYDKGDHVVYNGKVYVAQWWTQNQAPGDPWGPWMEYGNYIAVGNTYIRAWTASWVYTGGEKVVYNGKVWTAKWWTRNQAPGDPWGPWELVA